MAAHSVVSPRSPLKPILLGTGLGTGPSPVIPKMDTAEFPKESASEIRQIGENIVFLPAEGSTQDETVLRAISQEAERRQALLEEERIFQQKQMKKLEKLLSKSQFYSQHIAEKVRLAKEKENVANKKKKTTRTANVSPRQSFYRKTKLGVKVATQSCMSSPAKRCKQTSRGSKRKYDNESDASSDDDSESGAEESCAPEGHPNLWTSDLLLRNYQLEGYEWLKSLQANGANGILADEMGLGKTVQCIAMIAWLIESGVGGPFLICVPVSVLPNWMKEFARFTPKIPVVLYYGTKEERQQLQRMKIRKCGAYRTLPVVLTSYQVVMNDNQFFRQHTWKYLVIDEAQRIKNSKCLFTGTLKGIQSRNRLLMTGTPLQNDLQELWSLLNFLLPSLFNDLELFNSWFDINSLKTAEGDLKIVEQEREQQLLSKFHQILDPFLLRRLKVDVEPSLPPKREILVYAPMTERQCILYKALLNFTIFDMIKKDKENVDTNTPVSPAGRKPRACNTKKLKTYNENTNFDEYLDGLIAKLEIESKVQPKMPKRTVAWRVAMQNRMMQFRKCVNHTYLLECPLEPGTPYRLVDENLVLSSGKMLVLDLLLPRLQDRGHKVLLFSQFTSFLDIVEDYCEMRNYEYSRLDGSIQMKKRITEIDKFMTDPKVFLFLLSTRAGGVGLNLTAADTVIILDSDWNPQNDLQAIDRCHRIGQEKPVMIYRLATHNTVDQAMVERASAKRKLEKIVIPKDKFKSGAKSKMPNMDLEELMKILKSTDINQIVDTATKEFFSNCDVEMMLDRSGMGKPLPAGPLKDVPRMFRVLSDGDDLDSVDQEI